MKFQGSIKGPGPYYGAPMGHNGPDPNGLPWALMGQALMGPPEPSWAGSYWDLLGVIEEPRPY